MTWSTHGTSGSHLCKIQTFSLITSNSHHITIFSWHNAHDPTNRMLTAACLSCLNIRQHIFIHRITWNFNLQQNPLKKSVEPTQETLHLQLILILAINVQINTNHNNQSRPQISEKNEQLVMALTYIKHCHNQFTQ